MYRILYVDDEPTLLEITRLSLERDGSFAVDTLTSAQLALEQLKTMRYDAIIADYQMPEMDGITFLKQFRASGDTTPFIIFTGRGREEVVIEALNSGADFYLQKGGEPKSQFAELTHKILTAVSRRRTEKLAKDTERRLHDIINFLPDATFAIDTEGCVIAWNRAIEEMTGIPSREILGRGNYEYAIPFYGERRPILIDLISIPGDELTPDQYAVIKKEGDILIAETTLPRPLGKYSVMLGKASLLKNDEGLVIGAIESIRDITEQKHAQEELKKAHDEYVNLLAHMDDVYYRSDAEGRLILASDSWAKTLGYDDLSECLYKNIADHFYADPSERKTLLEKVYRDGFVSDYEVTLKKKDGSPITVATSSYLRSDNSGTVPGIEGTWRDISLRKEYEREIIRKNEELTASYEQIAATEQALTLNLTELVKGQRLLEEGEKRYRTVFENTGTAMVVLEDDGIISLANDGFSRLSGFPKNEIEGKKKWTEFVVEEDLEWMLAQHRLRRQDGVNALPRYEFRFVTQSGEIRAIYLTIAIIPGTKQSVASLMDITGHKQAEAALQESRRQLDAMAANIPGVVYRFRVNPDGTYGFDYVSKRSHSILGIGNETATFFERVSAGIVGKDRERFLSSILHAVRTKTLWEFESIYVKPSGKTIWISAVSSPLMDRDNLVFDGVIFDNTDRKRVDETLKESEERFSQFFKTTLDSVFITSPDGHWIDCNDALVETFGYESRADVFAVPVSMLYAHPEERAGFLNQVERAGFVKEYPLQFRKRDGTVFDSLITIVARKNPEGTLKAFIGTVHDITERKRAEKALLRNAEELQASWEQLTATEEELRSSLDELTLKEEKIRESEERYRGLVDTVTSGVAIYEVTNDGASGRDYIIKDLNRMALEIEGKKREDVIGKNLFELRPAIDAYGLIPVFRQVWKTGIPAVFPQKNYVDENYSRWYENRVFRLQSGEIVAVYDDITERRQAEEALVESEETHRILLNESSDPIFSFYPDGTYRYVNRAFAEGVGKSVDQIIGKKIHDVFDPDEAEKRFSALRTVFSTGEGKEIEVRVPRPEGDRYYVTTIVPVKDDQGSVTSALCVSKEITGRRRVDAALREANRKLTLLSGITRHDINNQLTLLQGYQNILGRQQPGLEENEYFQKIGTAARRISAMIRFTGEYESIGVNAPVWQDCRTLADKVAQQVPPGSIMVTNDLPAGTEVFADPLIERVFYNLIDNAVRYGGKVTTVRFSVEDRDGRMVIVCQDDGCGICMEEKEKIFERGFGQNTGLGLALSREILDITGITIKETGEPGTGARFEITVPKGAYRHAG